MKLNGSEILVECLKEQGVDTVFGYPGGAVLNIYDALYRHQSEIRHILTSHEQGAAHAADGYARSTGKVGVCIATSGPGATNLVTGIATAYMDSVPIVAVTGNVGVSLLGKDSFQEVDIAGITMPITKHNFIVKDVTKLADTMRRAFSIARSGRPGPVLVDITKDVTGAEADYEPQRPEPAKRSVERITQEDLATAAELINASKRPMIFVGGGAVISGASKELAELVERMDAPVCDSLMGKGAMDGEDPHYTGMLGMHGTKTSNYAVTECDLLLAIGVRFSDRVTGNIARFAPDAKIVHIDVDPAEINKNVRVYASVTGDVKEVLIRLLPQVKQAEHREWMEGIEKRKKQFPLKYHPDVLTGPYIVETLYRITGGDAIVTAEVGQHQMWAAQYYRYRKPRTFLSSGGLGTMGYGLGACIGAKVANPEKTVVNIAGDGCFRMNMNELATATRYHIPIVELVFDNHVLGMVRQWQTLFYEKRYSYTTLEDPVDFVKLAEAMGARAYRVTEKEEVEPVLRQAIALGEPVLIDFQIASDDKVWPMVAPGAAIEEAFEEGDLQEEKM